MQITVNIFIKDYIAENAHESDFFIIPVVPQRHAAQMSQYSENRENMM